MRNTIGVLFLVLAVAASAPSTRAGDKESPDDRGTPTELKDRVKRSFDEANAYHAEAVRLQEEAAKKEQMAETKRAEAMKLQGEMATRDQRSADRMRAHSLRRDADETDLMAASAERSSRELEQRAQYLRTDAREQRALAEKRSQMVETERDSARRSRLDYQSKFLAQEADRKEAEAERLEKDSRDAAARAERFRDMARKSREDADKIERGLSAEERPESPRQRTGEEPRRSEAR